MKTPQTPVDPVETAPLVDQAYQALRRDIIRGEFTAGQRLRVEELSRRYTLSSSPLREALNRLVQDGLVKALENKGFRVAPMSAEGMADLTRVRLLLECEALADAMRHGDDRWEAAVVAAQHSLSLIEQRLPEGPVVLNDEWSARHRALHLAIFSGCTSPLLLTMVETLFDHAERYRRFSAKHRKAERAKASEHQRLVNAVLSRDVEKALVLQRQHIGNTERNVTAALLAVNAATTH